MTLVDRPDTDLRGSDHRRTGPAPVSPPRARREPASRTGPRSRPLPARLVARLVADLNEPVTGRRVPATVPVFVLGCLVSALASWWTVSHDTNLDYGDAMAHLTISRRIIDSKAPGLQQLGTVWLPLPHLLLMPLVQDLFLFRTGIAACILGSLCLGVSAAATYRTAARLGFGGPARVACLAVLLANPSLLYASTTALTEPVLIAALASCVAGLAGWATSRRRLSGGELAVFAGLPAAAGVLTRYEGWALVISGTIFVVIVVLRRGDGVRRAITLGLSFAAAPALAVGWWLAYNTAWYGDPFEFLTGDYSAAAFTEVFREQGQLTTAGNPGLSAQVFGWSLLETAGLAPVVLAGLGLLVLTARRGIDDHALVIWLAGTSSAFLLFSLSTGQHIMVNDVSLPIGAYNNRYVLSAIPWVALLCGYLADQVLRMPRRDGATAGRRGVAAAVVATTAVVTVGQNVWWAGDPGERMTVIEEAHAGHDLFVPAKTMARWLRDHYDGGGILMDESTEGLAVAPIIGIPLDEYFNRASGRLFDEALADPDTHARWVVMRIRDQGLAATDAGGDHVAAALADDPQFHADYEVVFTITDIVVYRRSTDPVPVPVDPS